MQILKGNRRAKILKSARKEFLANGYEKTTMNAIAVGAGVAAGNIYDYFKSKEEIFNAVVYPIIDRIEKLLDILEKRIMLRKERISSFDWSQVIVRRIVSYAAANRDDLCLLLFKSQTVAEEFRRRFVNRFTDITTKYFDFIKTKYPNIRPISRLLAKNLIIFYVNVFENILAEGVEHTKMREYAEEITTFVWHGFQAVINGDGNWN